MKLCNICLKTFKDTYALNRHINKQKKCTEITTENNLIPPDINLELIGEVENKLIIIKSKNKHNDYNDISKTSIIEPSSLPDNTIKTILINKCELNTKNTTKNTTIINNTDSDNHKICDLKINATLEKTGNIYNCSLCHVEFKHKNNFYRHKKKCIITNQ